MGPARGARRQAARNKLKARTIGTLADALPVVTVALAPLSANAAPLEQAPLHAKLQGELKHVTLPASAATLPPAVTDAPCWLPKSPAIAVVGGLGWIWNVALAADWISPIATVSVATQSAGAASPVVSMENELPLPLVQVALASALAATAVKAPPCAAHESAQDSVQVAPSGQELPADEAAMLRGGGKRERRRWGGLW